VKSRKCHSIVGNTHCFVSVRSMLAILTIALDSFPVHTYSTIMILMYNHCSYRTVLTKTQHGKSSECTQNTSFHLFLQEFSSSWFVNMLRYLSCVLLPLFKKNLRKNSEYLFWKYSKVLCLEKVISHSRCRSYCRL
jgi:hypothetical protein